MTNVATVQNETLLRGIELPAESTVVTAELRPANRCDRCGAAAYVRTVKGNLELLFCGNHARRNAEALLSGGWLIDDQSHRVFDSKIAMK